MKELVQEVFKKTSILLIVSTLISCSSTHHVCVKQPPLSYNSPLWVPGFGIIMEPKIIFNNPPLSKKYKIKK